jgi:hypothetical protein
MEEYYLRDRREKKMNEGKGQLDGIRVSLEYEKSVKIQYMEKCIWAVKIVVWQYIVCTCFFVLIIVYT